MRRRFAWLVLIGWVVVAAAVGPVANRIWGATSDDATAWLPGSAESTAVTAAKARFPTGDTRPAIVVFARESGLTAADRAAIDADRARLAAAFPGLGGAQPVPSTDGRAAMLTIALPTDAGSGVVRDLRSAAARDLPDGLVVRTTGPAAAAADVGDAFSGLDATLLGASVLVVAVVLLLTYRSPVLWLLPLAVVATASQLACALVYLLIRHAGLVVNSQNAGVLTVLVFGIGTDYALLLISRYREELRRHTDRYAAMAVALRRAVPAILASATTVAAGAACLLLADLAPDSGLAPVGVIGVACALLAMTTLLPALLLVCGRWVFWPAVPRAGAATVAPPATRDGGWGRVAAGVSARPWRFALATATVLAALAVAATGMRVGLSDDQSYTHTPESVRGQRLIAAHFPAGSSDPAVVLSSAASAARVAAAVLGVPGVASVDPAVVSADGRLARTPVLLTDAADSAAAEHTIQRLRATVHAVPGADARVGGTTATRYDTDAANAHDRRVVIPLVLLAVLVVLIGLLRSLVAPLVLMATVVLSFGGALGAGWLIFRYGFGFAGVDPSVILLGFLFLVSVGVDYNIFLISRVQEEARRAGHRAGVRLGLTRTGGVITSAGLVLAATFSVLNVLPLVATAELGILVGVGILIDTLVVRSLLVPALALLIGPRFWWPNRIGT
jgi:RND superfamily putative drug exporter